MQFSYEGARVYSICLLFPPLLKKKNGAGAAALGDGGAILVGSWGKTDKVQILEEGGGGWKTVEPYPEGGMRYPHVEAKYDSDSG